MIELYESRAEQDRAVEQLLRSIKGATKRYSVGFMEAINGSDHEAYAAVVLGYVDVWMSG